MGLDYHGLCFLKWAARPEGLGRVATLGRQNIHVRPEEIRLICGSADDSHQFGDFCEALLASAFKASVVHSFDASDYEGATFIRNMNAPLLDHEEYDTVVDFGTTEHIFNVAQALQNIVRLCSVGGQIIHVVPANNFNGHGFWQFSPELFFSLYSRENGFEDTQVLIAELHDHSKWYQVARPAGGVRVEFKSRSATYVMARTTKVRVCDELVVQQSDYLSDWEQRASKTSSRDGLTPPATGLKLALAPLVRTIPFAARCFINDLRNVNDLQRNTSAFRSFAIREAIAHDRPRPSPDRSPILAKGQQTAVAQAPGGA